MSDKPDLCTCDADTFSNILREAARLGAKNFGYARMTGKQLCQRYASAWRRGHERALRLAYTAGAFHVDAKASDGTFGDEVKVQP
jgi:hypothetical protein